MSDLNISRENVRSSVLMPIHMTGRWSIISHIRSKQVGLSVEKLCKMFQTIFHLLLNAPFPQHTGAMGDNAHSMRSLEFGWTEFSWKIVCGTGSIVEIRHTIDLYKKYRCVL